jgi:hypothetical protein
MSYIPRPHHYWLVHSSRHHRSRLGLFACREHRGGITVVGKLSDLGIDQCAFVCKIDLDLRTHGLDVDDAAFGEIAGADKECHNWRHVVPCLRIRLPASRGNDVARRALLRLAEAAENIGCLGAC